MPIYAPGLRKKGLRPQSVKKDIVAVLQLTAMVDMFTVLVVFLLQNYAVTDQILPISEEIKLPQAQEAAALKPSHVVILSEKGLVRLNESNLGFLAEKTSKDQWVFQPLKTKMEELLQMSESEGPGFIMEQIKKLRDLEEEDLAKDAPFRVTIQADEYTDFLDIKKIMYTLTAAGVKEMNFAVIKNPEFSK